MRRSASEIIRKLETRIAQLENSTSRRTKSAAQKRTLTNARCIIMIRRKHLWKHHRIELCFMHIDRAILKKCVQDFKNSLNDPMGKTYILNVVETSSCDSCVCITVNTVPTYTGVEDFENPPASRVWIEETILNLPNSIPAK